MPEIGIKNTFTKEEKLCGDKRIDALFAAGNSFISYPLRVVFLTSASDDEHISVLVSVSKKKFKRAVKRNRIKRLIREAYRLNKSKFSAIAQQNNLSADIAFLYLKNELPSYEEIEKAMLKSASILSEKLQTAPTK